MDLTEIFSEIITAKRKSVFSDIRKKEELTTLSVEGIDFSGLFSASHGQLYNK